MRKLWGVKQLSDKAKSLGRKLGLNAIIVQILFNRDIREEDFQSFLKPQDCSLFSPSLLPDIETAVSRIRKAISNKERIFLFGDYDVDGITSLVILHDFLKDYDLDVSFYIPHRLKEGFGLNKQAIKKIKRKGANLLICCDCGTNSFEEIELAKSLGIDTIVVDHHQPKDGLNSALAFINPKRGDSCYPFAHLSSAGVAFKLVQALKQKPSWHLLDLVALSIVCDVMPLKGENRVLLCEGLKRLKLGGRFSLNALCEISGVKTENIDTFHLGYILGPRINASGRVNTAHDALAMFLAKDSSSAKEYARKLESYNRHRRDVQAVVLNEAERIIAKDYDNSPTLVVYKQGWHHGVLGIVASRLANKYHRPVFVVGFDNNRGKGSARSVANFNLMDALESCQDYLCAYGGHKKAAGIEIFYKDIGAFKKKLNEVAKKMLSESDLIPVLDVELDIGFQDINLELAEQIEDLKPFGEGNPNPLFVSRAVSLKELPKKINNGMHSVWLTDGGFTYEGVFSTRSGFLDILNYGKCFDMVYTLEKNHYHNNVRLVFKDLRLH